MASKTKRRKQWVVVWRDGMRKQRTKFFGKGNNASDTADAFLAELIPQARQKRRPVVDPKITTTDFGQRWLDQVEALVQAGERKPRTLETYDDVLRLHVEPRFGPTPVRDVGRAEVKDLLLDKLRAGYDATTVSIIYRTLRAMLSAAVDDGVISVNPIARLGRTLGLAPSKADRQQAVRTKAMTRAQLATFLMTALVRERRWYPLFLTLARSGPRLGEAVALQVGLHDDGDLDFVHREITFARALSDDGRRIDRPKTGEARVVDMSQQLADVLRTHVIARRAEALQGGQRPTSASGSLPSKRAAPSTHIMCAGPSPACSSMPSSRRTSPLTACATPSLQSCSPRESHPPTCRRSSGTRASP